MLQDVCSDLQVIHRFDVTDSCCLVIHKCDSAKVAVKLKMVDEGLVFTGDLYAS